MDVARINECGCVSFAAYDNTLGEFATLFSRWLFSFSGLPAPLFRSEGYVLVGGAYLRFCGPPRGTVLAIANGLGLNSVKVVHLVSHGD